jgi:hypothetical protein
MNKDPAVDGLSGTHTMPDMPGATQEESNVGMFIILK